MDDVLVLVLRVNVLVWHRSWHSVSRSWGLVLWCYYCYQVALCRLTISGASYIHAGLVLPHWTLVIVLNCICMCLQFLYCICVVWKQAGLGLMVSGPTSFWHAELGLLFSGPCLPPMLWHCCRNTVLAVDIVKYILYIPFIPLYLFVCVCARVCVCVCVCVCVADIERGVNIVE